MLRRIYYSLSPNLRLLARKIVYFPIDIFKSKKNSLEPPKGLIYTGSGEFIKQGEEWVEFFKSNTTLNENSNVLDIGSGIGRIAVPMTKFLKGNYCGFEPVQQGVDWCQNNISSKFTNFNFLYVDLFNDLYKSNGINAANYVFPYQKNYFDFACSISVFTHMLPDEVKNYLKEALKVLEKGGFLVATFFILDSESKSLMQNNKDFNFKFDLGHYALMDNVVKSANVGYDKDFLFKQFENIGFEIEKHVKGYWCGRKKEYNYAFQDIVVLKKL